MKIAVKQINETELNAYIATASSGSAFSGNLVAYYTASGLFGPNVVYTTGAQSITGTKTFLLSPIIPYGGVAGTAASVNWVGDQLNTNSGFNELNFVHRFGTEVISGSKTFDSPVTVNSPTTTGHAVNLGYLTGVSGIVVGQGSSSASSASGALDTKLTATGAALSAVKVSGSSVINIADFTGLGGTNVFHSGGKIFISGGSAGGSSNTSVTGSSAIAAPNFTGVGSVTLTYDGTYVKVSGAPGVDAAFSGFVESTFVHLTGTETISGVKTFATSPTVPSATLTAQAVNFGQLTGVSGALVAAAAITNYYYITGTGVVNAFSHASGSINNTFTITSGNTNVINSGSTTNTFNNSGSIIVSNSGTVTNNYNGAVNNITNLSGITGNFVNISFWFDQNNLTTGLNTIEAFVSRSFYFTGYGLGVINTGTQGFFSGSFYQRNQTSVKTSFIDFSLNSGVYFNSVGGLFQEITGMNRVGLDIYRIGTGITGLTVGLFGVGY